MARTPFTLELLKDIYDHTGTMSYDLLIEALPDWEMADIKQRLASWRYRKSIDYTIKNEELETFVFLRNKQASTEEVNAGRMLKLEDYYKQLVVTREIMEKPTAKNSDRLKAIELYQRAMSKIPDHIYKELSEIYA